MTRKKVAPNGDDLRWVADLLDGDAADLGQLPGCEGKVAACRRLARMARSEAVQVDHALVDKMNKEKE